ncbi:MAG: hypothetical protein KC417_06110 [Myxococcales bacterium]|nr:hypothetical protein [Myxococcales bacterium]
MRWAGLLALAVFFAVGCDELSAKCVAPDVDAGAGASNAAPATLQCVTDDGHEPMLTGQIAVPCGAEVWAVKVCVRSDAGFVTCQDQCGTVAKEAAMCDAAGDATCADGKAASCEYFPLPSEDDCAGLLEQCSQRTVYSLLAAPQTTGTRVGGCAYGRSLGFVREIKGDDLALPFLVP